MDLSKIFVPDGTSPQTALHRSTHLAVGAHQDDLEILGFHGILQGHATRSFSGIVLTDGRGSPREGRFANVSDEEMVQLRHQEQIRAAHLGGYSSIIQMGIPSAQIKGQHRASVAEELRKILQLSQCKVLYTHSPADRHDTHVATLAVVLQALRGIPPAQRPHSVLGCEVWRDLDWVPEKYLTQLDVSGHDALAVNLLGCFESQLAGGKRYDLAVVGRRRAQATFREAYRADKFESVTLALELSPFIDNPLSIWKWMALLQEEFKNDIQDRGLKFFAER